MKERSHINAHIDVVHKEPHKCSVWDYSCTTKDALKKHRNAVHEGKKPHKCSICDRSFALKHQLKTHNNTIHEGKKPYM
jgi:KRAB domain-containing zinc finger protein